jgi:hypothetical protein
MATWLREREYSLRDRAFEQPDVQQRLERNIFRRASLAQPAAESSSALAPSVERIQSRSRRGRPRRMLGETP